MKCNLDTYSELLVYILVLMFKEPFSDTLLYLH